MLICPKCGGVLEPEDLFCNNCGARLRAQSSPSHPGDVERPAPKPLAPPKPPKPPKGSGLKPVIIALSCVAVGLILAIAAVILIPVIRDGSAKGPGLFAPEQDDEPGNDYHYSLYIKDDELWCADHEGGEPWQVTGSLQGSEELAAYLNYPVRLLNQYFQIRDGGTLVFYPDHMDSEGAFTLCVRSLTDPEEEPVEICDDVTGYFADEPGTTVACVTGGDLYIFDLSKDREECIVRDVEALPLVEDEKPFAASRDCGSVLYMSDGDLYLWTDRDGATKISSHVTRVWKVSGEFDWICYQKEEALHLWTDGNDVKIESDIYNVLAVTDDGLIYYTVDESEDVDILSFFGDRGSASAALRDEIALLEYDGLFRRLYCFDGEDSEPVGDGYLTYSAASRDRQILAFSLCGYGELDADLSRVSHASSLLGIVESAAATDSEWFIASGRQVSATSLKGYAYVQGDETGAVFCFAVLDDGDAVNDPYSVDDFSADLYRVAVSHSEDLPPELIDEDIYYRDFAVMDGGDVAYFKDRDSATYEADLYISGNKVDGNVVTCTVDRDIGISLFSAIRVLPEGGVVCWTDPDDDYLCTLKYYGDGGPAVLAEDVFIYDLSLGGKLYYLADYSVQRGYGDLYVFDGEEAVKLDEDVSAVLTFSADD